MQVSHDERVCTNSMLAKLIGIVPGYLTNEALYFIQSEIVSNWRNQKYLFRQSVPDLEV